MNKPNDCRIDNLTKLTTEVELIEQNWHLSISSTDLIIAAIFTPLALSPTRQNLKKTVIRYGPAKNCDKVWICEKMRSSLKCTVVICVFM